jgi:hypothetical protein
MAIKYIVLFVETPRKFIFNVLIRLVYNGLLLTYIQLIRPEKFVWFQIDWTIFNIFYI